MNHPSSPKPPKWSSPLNSPQYFSRESLPPTTQIQTSNILKTTPKIYHSNVTEKDNSHYNVGNGMVRSPTV